MPAQIPATFSRRRALWQMWARLRRAPPSPSNHCKACHCLRIVLHNCGSSGVHTWPRTNRNVVVFRQPTRVLTIYLAHLRLFPCHQSTSRRSAPELATIEFIRKRENSRAFARELCDLIVSSGTTTITMRCLIGNRSTSRSCPSSWLFFQETIATINQRRRQSTTMPIVYCAPSRTTPVNTRLTCGTSASGRAGGRPTESSIGRPLADLSPLNRHQIAI